MKKRRTRWYVITAMFLMVFAVYCGRSEAAGKRYFITWGTTSPTSSVYSYYGVLAKFLNSEIPNINVTLRATGASVENTKLLQKGEVELGGATSKTMWEARKGIGPFKGHPYLDGRVVYPIASNPLQFVVSEKSGIKSIYDLEGKPFTPGQIGSAAEETSMDILKALGIKPRIRLSSYQDAVEAMKDRSIVGFSVFAVPQAMVINVASVMKIRILSLSEADVKKIVENTVGLAPVVVPAGAYPGVGEFRTVRNQYLEYARKDVPDRIVYQILSVVWKNRAAIKRTFRPFPADQFPEVVLGTNTCPMHPGAVKWYRDKGFSVPERLISADQK